MKNISAKIQDYRQKINLTQEGLAEQLDVSRQSVSKWELGQTLPEVDKIIAMSKLFGVSTDELLDMPVTPQSRDNLLKMGAVYLVTKNLPKAITFYERLLSMRVSTRHPVFAEFFFDQHCIALMEESKLIGFTYPPEPTDNSYKFVLSFHVKDLVAEFIRLKLLNIGEMSDIQDSITSHYFFHIRDVDNNVIEITGKVYDTRRIKDMETIYCQSCGGDLLEMGHGKDLHGNPNEDYCQYCCPEGKFDDPDFQTLEQMIEACAPYLVEAGKAKDLETAREMLEERLPSLKRWRKG